MRAMPFENQDELPTNEACTTADEQERECAGLLEPVKDSAL